jgi:hypothetical protein
MNLNFFARWWEHPQLQADAAQQAQPAAPSIADSEEFFDVMPIADNEAFLDVIASEVSDEQVNIHARLLCS